MARNKLASNLVVRPLMPAEYPVGGGGLGSSSNEQFEPTATMQRVMSRATEQMNSTSQLAVMAQSQGGGGGDE